MTIEQTFLTEDEIAHLTGFKRRLKQVEVLKANGTPFTLTGRGKPVVCRAAVEGKAKADQPTPKKAWTPKLAKAS